jgi:flavin-dependent dehydrogenase
VRCDVIVAGAGPAGALAATILARAGARVQLFDRARFPRAKLCGDTLNPGALRVLASHLPTTVIEQRGFPLDGMVLTGPGAAVTGLYPRGLRGRSLTRHELDALLLDQAVAAGARFEENVLVAGPAIDSSRRIVDGVMLKGRDGRSCRHGARLVIAADGRSSRLARAAGLAGYAASPRRWAIGGYFEGVEGLTHRGEMHVRAGHYIGVAPMPDGLANCCLVVPRDARATRWRDPGPVLIAAVRGDARLADRFARARLVAPPQMLGPMAVDARAAAVPGMLLAGDAAGFIDPITGDGLCFAMAGACLAATVAVDVLAGRLDAAGAVSALAARRREMFAAKWRFNRVIRSLVARAAALSAAAAAARVIPSVFEAIVCYAGDCDLGKAILEGGEG